MVSKKIAQALAGSSVIRAMFNEGKEMAARYGAENVYDFSLGNPATPAPAIASISFFTRPHRIVYNIKRKIAS